MKNSNVSKVAQSRTILFINKFAFKSSFNMKTFLMKKIKERKEGKMEGETNLNKPRVQCTQTN